MVHFQHQLLETRTERAHLNGKSHNRAYTKIKMTEYSCFADELTMMKKISSAKDLELGQMQIKIKAFAGEFKG